jgi:hypothetical protein
MSPLCDEELRNPENSLLGTYVASMTWKRDLASLFHWKRHRGTDSVEPVGDSLDDIFAHVYRERLWGAPKPWIRTRFFSGPGSHEAAIVKPYIAAVEGFVSARKGMDAVDLGCGDFNVGKRIRNRFKKYTACDIVPELIHHNERLFAQMNVDFRCLNISMDPLPPGDIVFLRQVLQHLSNEQIARVVSKLEDYRFLILTEHLPDKSFFTPNLDHKSGSGLRLGRDSGVVLTSAPFNLKFKSHSTLCSVRHFGGIIQTDVYEIR